MAVAAGSFFISRRVVSSAGLLLLCAGVPGTIAQDDADCEGVSVSGLLDADGFPPEGAVYSNTVDEEATRGEYVNSDESFFIWYSPTDPEEYTADTPDAAYGDCTGMWVISSYPIGTKFEDEVWYQSSGGAQCETSPVQLSSDQWDREVRGNSSEAVDVTVTCAEVVDDEGGGGVSDRDIILILIVVGVGFMASLCCGALICCIRGRNGQEEAVMPPGELGEGSVIGGKAEELKPGLHAHPEVAGQQHPRPEDWAPSYNSSRSSIPLGSRSGPSVRSIGYS
ncbi:unnamed protein product [Ascophyllum nodosum]